MRLLVILAVPVLLLALTGCGVGPATNQEKVSKTSVTYLKALARGDAATACEQLTRRARGSACEAVLTKRLSHLDAGTLRSAADDSMDIAVHGAVATAGLSEPEGARFVLAKVGDRWRIDSGYTVSPGTNT